MKYWIYKKRIQDANIQKIKRKKKNILIIKICIIAREKRKTLFRNNPCFVKSKKKNRAPEGTLFSILSC